MSRSRILIFLIWMCYFSITDAILCYSCATSKGKSLCENWRYLQSERQMYEKSDLKTSMMKNCTGDNFSDFCSIEKIETKGALMSFIRDCSDGKTFSFSLDKITKSLKSDNHTVCSYEDQGHLVCITLCDTDLCNGPSAASGLHPIKILIGMLLLYELRFL